MKSIFLTLLLILTFWGYINSQVTFDMHLLEDPEGTYTLQIISTSDDNTDVQIASGQTSLKVKVPSGGTISPSGGWTAEIAASASAVQSNCGYTPSWDLWRLFPGSDIDAGSMPNGTSYDLTDFTFDANSGDVYAFEDNETAEPCVSGAFDNSLNVDIDGGSASYNAQALAGSTTLYTSQPIILRDFSAIKYNSSSSYLSWTAYDMVDFDRFEIQRSIDSRNWVFAGTVHSYQFSRNNDFSFVDKDVYNGVGDQTIYYRLRMIDLDGGYRFSQIRSVAFEPKDAIISLEIYPNPSSEKVYFTLSGIKTDSKVDITIFDNTGKMVYRKDLDRLSKSNLLLDNQRLNMDSGVYNVVIADDKGNRVYKKLILTK